MQTSTPENKVIEPPFIETLTNRISYFTVFLLICFSILMVILSVYGGNSTIYTSIILICASLNLLSCMIVLAPGIIMGIASGR